MYSQPCLSSYKEQPIFLPNDDIHQTYWQTPTSSTRGETSGVKLVDLLRENFLLVVPAVHYGIEWYPRRLKRKKMLSAMLRGYPKVLTLFL